MSKTSNDEYSPVEYDEAHGPVDPAETKRAPAKRTSGTKAPASARQPQDRKRSAAELEAAEAETFPVEWRGLTFDIVADPDDWDFWTVTTPLSQGNTPAALLGLLGPTQAHKLRMKFPQLRNPDARELFDLINREIGFRNTGN